MPIPSFLLDRIQTSAMSGPQVADVFAKLAKVADQTGIDGCAINLEYVGDNDTVRPGNLVPSITFSLERQKLEVRPTDPDTVVPAEEPVGLDNEPYPEE